MTAKGDAHAAMSDCLMRYASDDEGERGDCA